jgi:ABC-2 type transport system ATP-binding protein
MLDGRLMIVRQLTKSFGTHKVLRNISFDLYQNEVLGILGPNGAGKSTLLNILSGLLLSNSGYVSIFGLKMSDIEKIKEKLSVVPQATALYRDLTVSENMNFFGEIYVKSKAEREKRIHDMMDLLKIEDKKDVLIRKLSGGYQKRVSIAIALLNKPAILLLDEPTAGIDASTNDLLFSFIKNIKRKMSVIFTTHSISEAEELCDRVLILDDGVIVSQGDPKLISRKYAEFAGERIYVEFKHDDFDIISSVAESLRKYNVVKWINRGDNFLEIYVSHVGDNVLSLLQFVLKYREHIKDIDINKPKLRNYFLDIVKHGVRTA